MPKLYCCISSSPCDRDARKPLPRFITAICKYCTIVLKVEFKDGEKSKMDTNGMARLYSSNNTRKAATAIDHALTANRK